MRRNILFVISLLMVAFRSAQAQPPSDAQIKVELDHVQAMQKQLDRSSLWPFLDAAKSERWSVPWIHSEYWVACLPEKQEERIKLEKAKRRFGFSIAKAFDSEGLKIMQPADTTTRERQSKRLLDSADWLRKSRGYGNLLLVARAENLACVPMCYLVADLNYSTNDITALIKRISTPVEDLGFQLAVLDEEAPMPLNVSRNGSTKEVIDRLDIAWSRKMEKGKTWCEQNGANFAKASKQRNLMPPEIAFFADDEAMTMPYTIANSWNEKQHHIFCINGSVKDICKAVQTLYLFRSKVGSFPTNPPAWFGPQEKKYTAIEAAFTQAWEPYETYGQIGQFAAMVYASIRSNRLMDWETQQIVEALEEAKARPK